MFVLYMHNISKSHKKIVKFIISSNLLCHGETTVQVNFDNTCCSLEYSTCISFKLYSAVFIIDINDILSMDCMRFVLISYYVYDS